jgi:triphosphatase
MIEERVGPLRHVAEPERGALALEKEFAARREQAFRRARKAIQTKRYRDLPLDVLKWLETRRIGSKDEAQVSIADFVGDLFRRRLRKAKKEALHLEKLSAPKRHKLRIRIKKMRYAAGFFESLYSDADRKKLARFSARLKELQDTLGASGVMIGQEHEAAKTLMKTARQEFDRLQPLKAKPV